MRKRLKGPIGARETLARIEGSVTSERHTLHWLLHVKI